MCTATARPAVDRHCLCSRCIEPDRLRRSVSPVSNLSSGGPQRRVRCCTSRHRPGRQFRPGSRRTGLYCRPCHTVGSPLHSRRPATEYHDTEPVISYFRQRCTVWIAYHQWCLRSDGTTSRLDHRRHLARQGFPIQDVSMRVRRTPSSPRADPT